MSDTYIEAFYHFVWATKKREDMIGPEIETGLYDFLRRRCEDMDVHVYALNGMPDHVHLVCAPPMSHTIPAFIQALKGGSSHYVNYLSRSDSRGSSLAPCLYWQPGYEFLTFSQDRLERVIGYVDRQKQHHQQGRLWTKLERTESPAITVAQE